MTTTFDFSDKVRIGRSIVSMIAEDPRASRDERIEALNNMRKEITKERRNLVPKRSGRRC